ncbi:MAG: succinate dehydrogenase, cytochrome b556 subunit [Pseudomonadota bacterium]
MTSAGTTEEGGRPARPLSPHLSIYRPIVTMVMSILHRITGILNVGGMLLVVGYLLAVASGPQAYADASWFFGSMVVRVVMVAFSWSLIHHMLGGIRHAIWDAGRGFGDVRYTMSWLTLFGSVTLTVLLWVFVITWEAV